MKKALCLTILLLTVISIAVAQSPATMTKGNEEVDTLCQNRLSVEIVDISGVHFSHPQHPENGIMCPTEFMLTTSSQYELYQWETSLPSSETWNEDIITIYLYYSGYIKVTVGDQNGNIGSDSIWFNVRNSEVPPMENFIMEIDDDLHAEFSGIVSEDHRRITIKRGFIPGQFIHSENFLLSSGIWNYKDTNAIYSDDSLWIYSVRLFNQCGSSISYRVPGVLLGAEEDRLSIKSILQDDIAPMFYEDDNFEYVVYTIDQYGERHIFENNGNPVVLQPEVTAWQIPGPHIDPYYQVGVGRQLEDGSYELLSLSNKVPNPWPDSDGINDENDDSSFSVFPNPSHGLVTVVGKGTLSVVNMLGQIVLRQEIDGESTVELPRGIYFVKLGGAVRKVVVE